MTGVDPALSSVRTCRDDFVELALLSGVRAGFTAPVEAFGDLSVCADLVCFSVELRVGARAVLILVEEIRGMRDNCTAMSEVLDTSRRSGLGLAPPELLVADVKAETGVWSALSALSLVGMLIESSGLDGRTRAFTGDPVVLGLSLLLYDSSICSPSMSAK